MYAKIFYLLTCLVELTGMNIIIGNGSPQSYFVLRINLFSANREGITRFNYRNNSEFLYKRDVRFCATTMYTER